MDPHHSRTREWIRRLSARGLPPGHVAFVLDVSEAAIVEALAPELAHAERVRRQRQYRRMKARGASLSEIGRRFGVHRMTVWYALRHPPEPRTEDHPLDASRGIRSDAGTRVRRLLALGYEPDRIAELMEFDPADVAEFASRLKGPDGRVRPRRRPPSNWDGDGPEYHDDDALVKPTIAAGMVPELVAIEARADDQAAAELPATAGDVGPWEAHYGMESARGHRNARAVLSDDQADKIRSERARGVSRAELAERFGVSVATITRLTTGRTYRTESRSADQSIDRGEVEPLPSPASKGDTPCAGAIAPLDALGSR